MTCSEDSAAEPGQAQGDVHVRGGEHPGLVELAQYALAAQGDPG